MKHSITKTSIRDLLTRNSPRSAIVALILLISGLFLPTLVKSQASICPTTPQVFQSNYNTSVLHPRVSPSGYFDTLRDIYGNKYHVNTVKINNGSSASAAQRPAPAQTCTAGVFVIDFDANCGFASNTPTAAAVRAAICQAYYDLSYLLNPGFAASTSTVKVHILIDGAGNYLGAAAATSSVLGAASAYYSFPNNPNSNFPGIADNLAQKTIISQMDGYTGIVPPILSAGGAGYYHGFMYLNFVNTSLNWNANTGIACPGNAYDVYGVTLHEAMHLIGFASSMNQNGISQFGAANNYFARFDRFLRTSTNVPLLNNMGGAACSPQYSLGYNAPANSMGVAGCTNTPANPANCFNPIKYVSGSLPNMPLYTPPCYESGSSISHFEDGCFPIGSPYGNDAFFVMSNGTTTGMTKRFVREEERKVLCDIGYPVNSLYSSPAFSANTTYTYTCNTPVVWGQNDGLLPLGGYAYISNGTPVSIPLSAIMGNDSPNTTSVSCVQSVYANGTAAVVGSNVVFTPVSGSFGVGLIRYVPKTASGAEGNITYIYVYIDNPNCATASVCDFVPNNGYESHLNCGSYAGGSSALTSTVYADCWDQLSYSPDIFARNCVTSNVPGSSANLGVNTYSMTPPFDSWSGSGSGNDAIMGLYAAKFNFTIPLTNLSEAASTKLTTPLIPGHTYILNVKLNPYKGYMRNLTGLPVPINQWGWPVVFSLGASFGPPICPSGIYPEAALVSSGQQTVLHSFTTSPTGFYQWQNFNTVFTYSPSTNQNANYLSIGIDLNKSLAIYAGAPYFYSGDIALYLGVDDVSLIDATQAVNFALPLSCNSNITYTNLSQYVSPAGTYSFSGTGVTFSGGQYHFNSGGSLAPGTYTVNCHFTTPGNCSGILSQTVLVSNPVVSVTNPSLSCASGSYTFQVNGLPSSASYTWLPSGSNAPLMVVSPSVLTTYSVIAQYGAACTFTQVIPVNAPPSPPVISGVPPVCIGSISNYFLNSFVPTLTLTGGTFNGLGIMAQSCPVPFGNCYQINLMPPATYTPGVYTYTYTGFANPLNGIYCPTTSTFNVQFLPDFSLAINGATCFTGGNSYTLSASTASLSGITYTWLPGGQTTPNLVITPTASTVYTLLASNGGCVRSATLSVVPIVPFTFVNPPNQICTYQSLYNLQQYLAPGTPTTGAWSSPSGMGVFYSPSPGVTHVNVNPTITPVGTHTIAYTYTPSSSPACNISIQFTINVGQGFSLNASLSQTYCANIPGNSVVISATGSPVPPSGITYVWQPGALAGQTVSVAPPNTTNYTVTATSGFCTFTTTTQVVAKDNCCVATNYITAPTLTTSTFGPGSYAINQDITITGNVNFSSAEFKLAPNVKITVQNGASLNISTAHLYSCFDMWNGIDVKGKLKIEKNSLIEDAITAVKSDQSNNLLNTPASADVFLNGSTFNRNLTAVSISNYVYNVQNGPYYISACVFTSRNLPFTATSWPNTGIVAPGLRAETTSSTALNTPYSMQNYPVANLKAPFSNIKASIGIYVERFGTASLLTNAPSPVYSSLLIGDETNNTRNNVFNLFDNLSFGIYAKNGNIKSMNNTFQNMKRSVSGTLTYGGIGIYSTHDSLIASNNVITVTHPLTLSSPALYSNLNNQFYDCFTGIRLNNIYTADLRYTDMRSTSNFALPPTNTLNVVGYQGIAIYGNRFLGHQIRNNTLRNMETGVSFYCSYGQMAIPGLASYGRYLYNVFITDNTIIPQYTLSSASTGGRVGLGVYAASSTNVLGQDLASPGYGIRVENNLLHNVWRGVEFNGWKNGGFRAIASTNTITLVQDINPVMQYGVKVTDCRDNAVTTNSITGYNLTNTLVTGVYSSLNANGQIECNNVNRLFAGFEFAGIQPGTSWKYNLLQNNARGLNMTFDARIGTQGSYNAPSDNQWLGSWAANSNTWTDNLTDAINSDLYIRSSTNYYPNFNLGVVPAQLYGLISGSLKLANNAAASFNCASLSGGGGNNGGGSGTAAAMTILNDVAADNTTYTVNAAQTEEINKNLVFEEVVKDPVLALNSATLATFYNDNLTTTRGVYKEVEQKLGTGDLYGADAKINSISPSTNIENNYKLYYELERKYSEWLSLDNADLTTLQVLCYQCPFTDGAIVYKARSLYNMVQNTNVQYHDYNCVADGFSFSRAGTGNTVSALETALLANELAMNVRFGEKVNYNLYPNPASGQFYIGCSKKVQVLMMRITDVQGRVLLKDNINIQNFNALIQTDLQNGIYFVTLVEENGQKTTKKLIIAK